MADLVRVRLPNGLEKTVGRAFAEKHSLTELDEPTHTAGGALRADTRAGGRRRKPKTTVATAAAKKAAKKTAASTQAPGPAPEADQAVTPSADDSKEQDQ